MKKEKLFKEVVDCAKELIELVDDPDYDFDTLTTQPLRIAIKEYEKSKIQTCPDCKHYWKSYKYCTSNQIRNCDGEFAYIMKRKFYCSEFEDRNE